MKHMTSVLALVYFSLPSPLQVFPKDFCNLLERVYGVNAAPFLSYSQQLFKALEENVASELIHYVVESI